MFSRFPVQNITVHGVAASRLLISRLALQSSDVHRAPHTVALCLFNGAFVRIR